LDAWTSGSDQRRGAKTSKKGLEVRKRKLADRITSPKGDGRIRPK